MLVGWLLVVAATSAVAQPPAEELVVIVHEAVEVVDIDGDFAMRLLSGRIPQWPDGTPVVIVLPPRASPSVGWLCAKLIRMPERTYRRFLLERAFRGSIEPIVTTTSEEDAVQTVQATPGAISVAPVAMMRPGIVTIEIP